MNYLSLSDANGNTVATVPIEPSGGTVRVAVGEVGRRSSVWRFWANSTSPDVYIAARTIAGIQKFSLHSSGRWRYGFTDQATDWVKEGNDRATDKWERPEPVDGLIAALAIVVRDRDVVEMPDDTKEREVHWIDAPPTGHLVSIRVSLLLPDTGVPVNLGGTPLVGIGLSDNSALLVAWKVEPIVPLEWEERDRQRSAVLERFPLPDRHPGKRLALFANDENRTRYVYDTAVLPDEIVIVG